MKRTLIIGSLGGLFLYIIETVCSFLVYTKLSFGVFGTLLSALIICAVLIAIFTMIFRTPSFVQILLRFFVFITSYVCIMLINAHIGTILFIEDILSLSSSSSSDNVSGMLTVTVLSIVIIASIITIIVFGITKLINACTK